MYAIPAMVLLILGGQFIGRGFERQTQALEEGDATVFAKKSFDEGTPDEEYLLGVRLKLADGRTIEDVLAVESAFWRQVKEGDTVRVQYRRDKETGAVELPMVVIPKAVH